MFEYIENGKEKKTLSNKDEESVISFIKHNWDVNSKVLDTIRERYDKLKQEVFLKGKSYIDLLKDKNLIDREKQNNNWKSKVKLAQLYCYYETKLSYLWENLNKSFSDLFNVDSDDKNKATIQKKFLIKQLINSDFKREFDKSLENLELIGEACLMLGIKTQYKKIKTKEIRENDNVLKEGVDYFLINRKVKEIINITTINPLDIVWDRDINPIDIDKWNNTPKIVRSYATYQEIRNNKSYKLKKGDLDELKDKFCLDKEKTGTDSLDENRTKISGDDNATNVDTNYIEILTFFGNIEIDGNFYENVLCTLIDGKYLARFLNNPFEINPIINFAYLRDPDTNRGIQPLASIYDICILEEYWVNKDKDRTELALNPPKWVATGLLRDNRIDIFPGACVEYRRELGSAPSRDIIRIDIPSSIETLDKLPGLQQYEKTISGIDPDKTSNLPNQERVTAEQIKATINGQGSRFSRQLDLIRQYFLLDFIKSFANFIALMQYGEVQQLDADVVNDEIRNYDYTYSFSTSDTIEQQKMNLNGIFAILDKFQNSPIGASINTSLYVELMDLAFNLFGFANIREKLANTPLQQIQSIISSLNEQQQQELMQVIKNFSEQKTMEKHLQEYRQKAQMQAQENAIREETRDNMRAQSAIDNTDINEIPQEYLQNAYDNQQRQDARDYIKSIKELQETDGQS